MRFGLPCAIWARHFELGPFDASPAALRVLSDELTRYVAARRRAADGRRRVAEVYLSGPFYAVFTRRFFAAAALSGLC